MKFQGKEYELEGQRDWPRRNGPRKRRNLRKLTLVMPLVLLKGLNFEGKDREILKIWEVLKV